MFKCVTKNIWCEKKKERNCYGENQIVSGKIIIRKPLKDSTAEFKN